MSIEFEDYRAQVKEAMDDAIIAFLHQAGGELVEGAVRQIDACKRVDTGQTKGSYQYKVEEGATESAVYVGSNLENAIWEEFGTGEYALKGNGRKGGWVYKSEKNGKFYRTKGKTPSRPLETSFNQKKTKLIKRCCEIVANKIGD